MAFLKDHQVAEIKGKLVEDNSTLGKLYKAKRSEFQTLSVDHSLVDGYIKQGWEVFGAPLKTKTKIRLKKPFAKQFEDDVWCQFYKLGYRILNFDENFVLPFSKKEGDTKQIDVVAINDETAFLIECKSSEKLKKAPSFKDEFELLGLRLDGFRKAIHQMFGSHIRVKYMFATRNLRLDPESEDLKRLFKTNSFYYNNNTYKYVNNLIDKYKDAAFYQFLGLVFKNELINQDKIEIAAVRGSMGKKNYYMFSIEPSLLLKMGFILHRTRANETEFPTYQRLLVPSRLKGITKFINDGGYFPNSVIINFNTKKHKIQFEGGSKTDSSTSTHGVLKIPNSYGIAYIIDGQHRVYGYANSDYKESNTIPVVAFDGLSSIEQLEIFMDINQNQKAVSPSLRLDLEEDLYWDSERADSRLKALRSSIIKSLSNLESSPLFNKISVGEDSSLLKFKPFTSGLINSGLLPSAKGNKYNENSLVGSLYNVNNQDHNKEMNSTKKKLVQFLIACYDFADNEYKEIFERENHFILSNRGAYAYITLIGSLNRFETEKGNVSRSTSTKDRLDAIEKYLVSLFEYFKNITPEEDEKIMTTYGSGAEVKWLRFFQNIVNSQYPEYEPKDLIDWKERQNDELQAQGRTYGVEIEKFMKRTILTKLEELFGNKWELEIGSIKRECVNRALQEDEKNHKEGLELEDTDWKDMFNINDYKSIIEKHWTKKPENASGNEFNTLESIFSIDIGEGLGSKAKNLKWISRFNSYRNLWAHEGTKEKRLNKEEVSFLEFIHSNFYQ